MKLTVGILLTVTMVVGTEPAIANRQGFSITPLDGWAASGGTPSQLVSSVQEPLRSLGDIDLDRIAVVIVHRAESREDRGLLGIHTALVADDESNSGRPSRMSYIITGAIIGGLYGLFKAFKK
jgi:hypothetical protein